MWLAPNMVTTLGFSFCFLSYLVTWYHSERLDILISSWVICLNGLCTIAYYTLDCKFVRHWDTSILHTTPTHTNTHELSYAIYS
jgi:hypothetical protein